MRIEEYQNETLKTDKVPGTKKDGIIVPLLGLAGEVGSLLSEYKKHLRDGKAHRLFKERLSEELGDILWYVSNTASKFELDLNAIALNNLKKTRERWPKSKKQTDLPLSNLLDENFPPNEQLPRHSQILFQEFKEREQRRVVLSRNGQPIGDHLTDNAYHDDGYRFHDVFHLAYAAYLGWSPVSRSMFKCKRRSNPQVDEIEDGGRAIVIEEGISAFVYDYARKHDFLRNIESLDYELLRTIRSLTTELEVRSRTLEEWEQAIFAGYFAWNQMRRHNGGVVSIDLEKRRITFRKR